MVKTRLITDYINSLIGQSRVFGENDCNLVACKIIDILAGSDIYTKLYQNYDSLEDGLKKAKELCGYSSVLQPIKEHFTLVDGELENGDLLVTEHKLGRRKYYSVALYFSGYVLIADEDDIWVTRPVYEIEYESVYRFGGE
ncbi:hypothetical protein OGT86_000327 [Salmonella enterica]|nr:hypothetical protein [Salmonella enterica]EDD4939538.1 hypothetical protein [Salmonella enterica subsp. enterica serovar Typhimurium]EAR3610344.1 hypothetical protein [Salmonella enterica]EAT4181254.1 hypothetical protein [Salmonella enterica]EBD6575215.1 hypothetical protein [Salmonella enterica]